jgi:uncharacterized protein
MESIQKEVVMSMPDSNTTHLSWNDFAFEIKDLARKVDFKPDLVIALVRGGVTPTALLSRELDIELIASLKIIKVKEKRVVIGDNLPEVKGKKVLVVDDMLETGKGFIEVRKYLQNKGADVKTCCMYIMPITEVTPDYFLREVNNVIKFPWE